MVSEFDAKIVCDKNGGVKHGKISRCNEIQVSFFLESYFAMNKSIHLNSNGKTLKS